MATKTLEHRKVLVLNKAWQAVNIIPLQDAITMLFPENGQAPRACIIDANQDFSTFSWDDWSKIKPENDDEIIRGVDRNFKIPEVILLSYYDKPARSRVRFSRRAIYKRDNYTCMYCGKTPGTEELSIDHIMPRFLGGETTWLNIALCCTTCNRRKGNKTLKQCGMRLLRQPYKPKFELFTEKKIIPKSWRNFVSESYWGVELQNDE